MKLIGQKLKKNKTIKKTPIETHETEGVLPKKVFFEYFEIPEDRKNLPATRMPT